MSGMKRFGGKAAAGGAAASAAAARAALFTLRSGMKLGSVGMRGRTASAAAGHGDSADPDLEPESDDIRHRGV
jgi:hypothetical protein